VGKEDLPVVPEIVPVVSETTPVTPETEPVIPEITHAISEPAPTIQEAELATPETEPTNETAADSTPIQSSLSAGIESLKHQLEKQANSKPQAKEEPKIEATKTDSTESPTINETNKPSEQKGKGKSDADSQAFSTEKIETQIADINQAIDAALTLLKNDNAKEAQAKLELIKGTNNMPAVKDFHYVLGICSLQNDKTDLAVNALELELKNFPDNDSAKELLDNILAAGNG